jgi:hypothetical protein
MERLHYKDRATTGCETVIGEPPGSASSGAFDADAHDSYWEDAYLREPYYKSGYTWEDYRPGYRIGYEGAARNRTMKRRFDELETDLRVQYERIKGRSRLAWQDAKIAARAAWDRVERAMPGDFDRDGR